MPFAEGRWHTKATHEVPLSERKNARQSRRSKWKLLGPYWDGGLGEKNERPERCEGGTVAGKGVANDAGLVTNSAQKTLIIALETSGRREREMASYGSRLRSRQGMRSSAYGRLS